MIAKLEEDLRKKVERQRGQLLILPTTKELRKAVSEVFGSSVTISDYHYAQALAAARTRALGLHNRFKRVNPNRYSQVVSGLGRITGIPPSYKIEEQLFVVNSFDYSVNRVKAAMLNYFVSKKILTDAQKKQLAPSLHKGHGTRGAAVSEVGIAASVATLGKEHIPSLLNAFQAAAKSAKLPSLQTKRIAELITDHEQIVNMDGTLKDEYFSIIEFQVGSENVGRDAAAEKALKKAWKDFVEELTPNILNMEGSSSLKQKMTRVLFAPFEGQPGVTLDSPDKNAELKTKHKPRTKGKATKSPIKARAGGRIRKHKGNQSSSSMPLFLIAEFNRQLPKVLRKNMNDPALVNRTGRFADSVRVTDLSITRQGYPSFGYTYNEDYKTFEPGNAQGSKDRDPRRLIDKSMREIALEFAIGRFYTRRH